MGESVKVSWLDRLANGKPPADQASGRCSGHCCRNFYLPYTPAELQDKAPDLEDGAVIAAMVIHRGPARVEGFQRYGCKHLDSSGDCSIYDARPAVCRRYPYGGRCVTIGCTLNQDATPEDAPTHWTDDQPEREAAELEAASHATEVPHG